MIIHKSWRDLGVVECSQGVTYQRLGTKKHQSRTELPDTYSVTVIRVSPRAYQIRKAERRNSGA